MILHAIAPRLAIRTRSNIARKSRLQRDGGRSIHHGPALRLHISRAAFRATTALSPGLLSRRVTSKPRSRALGPVSQHQLGRNPSAPFISISFRYKNGSRKISGITSPGRTGISSGYEIFIVVNPYRVRYKNWKAARVPIQFSECLVRERAASVSRLHGGTKAREILRCRKWRRISVVMCAPSPSD